MDYALEEETKTMHSICEENETLHCKLKETMMYYKRMMKNRDDVTHNLKQQLNECKKLRGVIINLRKSISTLKEKNFELRIKNAESVQAAAKWKTQCNLLESQLAASVQAAAKWKTQCNLLESQLAAMFDAGDMSSSISAGVNVGKATSSSSSENVIVTPPSPSNLTDASVSHSKSQDKNPINEPCSPPRANTSPPGSHSKRKRTPVRPNKQARKKKNPNRLSTRDAPKSRATRDAPKRRVSTRKRI